LDVDVSSGTIGVAGIGNTTVGGNTDNDLLDVEGSVQLNVAQMTAAVSNVSLGVATGKKSGVSAGTGAVSNNQISSAQGINVATANTGVATQTTQISINSTMGNGIGNTP
jgi:hypothetical protein